MTQPPSNFRTDKVTPRDTRDAREVPVSQFAARRDTTSSINNTPVVGPPKPNANSVDPQTEA